MRSSASFIGLAAVTTAVLCAPGCSGTVRNFGATGGSDAGGGKPGSSGGKAGSSGGKAGSSGGKSGPNVGQAGQNDSEAGQNGDEASAGEAGEQSQAGAAGAMTEAGGSGFGGTTSLAGAGGVSNKAGGGAGGSGGASALVPDTRITSTPPNPDNVAMPAFQFNSTVANSTFQCKFDAGAYAACTSPRTLSLGVDGSHTFSVFASAVGVDDPTPATYTWTLDTVPPTVTITAKPPAVTNETTANFTFSAEAGATVACSLDNGAFTACASATSHGATGLALGSHSFTVRATDTANNTSAATASNTATWNIEPPCAPVTIEAESLLPLTGWVNSFGNVLHGGNAVFANVINAPFSFTFQGRGLIIYNEKGSNVGKHTVSIDGATPVTVIGTDPNGFSFQNPTTIATGLPNIVHTATVVCIQQYCEIDYFNVTCQ